MNSFTLCSIHHIQNQIIAEIYPSEFSDTSVALNYNIFDDKKKPGPLLTIYILAQLPTRT